MEHLTRKEIVQDIIDILCIDKNVEILIINKDIIEATEEFYDSYEPPPDRYFGPPK